MSTSPARRRNPRGEGDRLRVALLDAATEKLAEVQDVDALSVRAVTAAAGVSPTSLYLHFADKDELVTAVKVRCFAALDERMAAAEAEHDGDPVAQVAALGRAYLGFAREQPGWYAAIFHTNFRKDLPRGDDGIAGAGLAVLLRVAAAARRCDPALGEEDAFVVGTFLWTTLHGRVAVTKAMPSFPFPDEEEWIARLTAQWVGSSRGAAADPTA
jgi:AcrR family transcriptional regulator